MLNYIYESLLCFRSNFRNTNTWTIFCMMILGFIGTSEMIGVTSFCRFWGLGEPAYMTFLHFFRVSNWSLQMLIMQWWAFILNQNVVFKVQGRAVVLGDHTYSPKDGCRMPGVVSLRQQSETNSKPSYFRGHCWGAIGILVGSMISPFCLPLSLGLHLGMLHIGKALESAIERKSETMGTRIVKMAIDFAHTNSLPITLVLDAFFPSGKVFKLANSLWSIDHHAPLVNLIVRAKKNYVGYFEFDPSQYKGWGPFPKYGDRIKLLEVFDHVQFFKEIECIVYGKLETILITSMDLLWKPTGSTIRFVFAKTKLGPIVLMCSDVTQDPVAAVSLYCLRVRIEVMFDMLKNLIGAFCYRFWSKKMPKHSRKPLKNKKLKHVPAINIPTVKKCWDGCERFVMSGAIALGLLQLVSLKFARDVWSQYQGFLRTQSRELPSERTVKNLISRYIINDIIFFPKNRIMRAIHARFFDVETRSKDPAAKFELDQYVA